MGKFETRVKPICCDVCSFAKPHTSDNGILVKRCEKTDELNSQSHETVLEDCPLPCEGCSEEEYHCVRENNV